MNRALKMEIRCIFLSFHPKIFHSRFSSFAGSLFSLMMLKHKKIKILLYSLSWSMNFPVLFLKLLISIWIFPHFFILEEFQFQLSTLEKIGFRTEKFTSGPLSSSTESFCWGLWKFRTSFQCRLFRMCVPYLQQNHLNFLRLSLVES